MFAASRAACVRVVRHPNISLCQRGASLFRSPVATEMSIGLFSADPFSFASGVACAMKSSTPRPLNRPRRGGLFRPVFHHRLDSHFAKLRGIFPLMPPSQTSFSCTTPSTSRPSTTTAASRLIVKLSSTACVTRPGIGPSGQHKCESHPPRFRSSSPAAHPKRESPPRSFESETKQLCVWLRYFSPAQSNFSFARTTIERPRVFRQQAMRAERIRSVPAYIRRRNKGRRHAVARVIVPVLSAAERPRHRLLPRRAPLVAITLRRISRSIPLIPIALSSAPIVVGIRHTNRAISTGWKTPTPE